MNASVPASTIAARVALGADQTWTNDSANPLTVSGVVSGAFGLTKAGTGLVTLTGVNTYSGSTILNDNSGTLDVSGTGRLGSGNYTQPIAIGTGSTLKFSSSGSGSTQTLSGAITGAGGLTMASSVANASLDLGNPGNLYSGTTTISSGRIIATPATGEISPNTAFVITGNGTSGGQLLLNGAGAVANDFSIAGVGFTDAGPVNAGAIRFSNGSSLSGTITLTGDSRVGFIAATSSATLSGQITGSAGIEFLAGLSANSATHTFTLNNVGTPNDYTGNTTISAVDYAAARTGGRSNVTLGANEQIPHGSGKGIVVFSGADTNHISILELNGFSEIINGVSNVAASGAIIRNSGGNASVLSIGDAITDSSFSGLISDSGTGNGTLALTKIGDSTLTLNGVVANTFTGATTISDGILTLSSSLALQNSALDTFNSIAGDPTNGLKTTVPTLTLGGLTGDKDLAAVFTTSGDYNTVTALTLNPGTGRTPSYSGGIADGAAGMTLIKTGAGTQTLDGALSHTGGVNVTGGVLRLGSSGNTYTGTTAISGGGRGIVVTANGALGAIGATNGTTVIGAGAGNGGALGFSGGIIYSAAEKITGSGAGHTSGTLAGFTTANRGFIQSVSGNNTFAGDIELSADGTSRIGTQDGASLTLTGAITQASGITTANILFRVGNSAGDFVTLSNAGNVFGGSPTIFSGATAGNYAGVRLGVDNALPLALTISGFAGSAEGTALDLAGNDQELNGLINNGSGLLKIINMNTGTPSTLTLNPTANLSTSNTLILGGGGLEVINVVKNGLFTQTLGGVNTYTGNTTVNAGTLILADNARLKFVIGATTANNNGVTGVGTVTIDGDFDIDTTLTDATALTTGSWTLVDAATLTETFNTSFTIVGAGWSQTADVWTKTVGSKKYTFTEADGTLVLSPGASYASWIDGFFPAITDPLIIGAGADPDNDGIDNGVEMVIGGNPATGMDTALLPTLELVTNPVGDPNTIPAGNYLLFTYRRSDLSVAAGVTAACQTDTDLVGPWTTAVDTVSGVVIQVDNDFTFPTFPAAATDRVRVYVPRGANTTLFGRLNVVVP
jgi:fibronectin-binding autotransporter adhesin